MPLLKTYGSILRETRLALEGAGVSSAALEARLICENAAGFSAAAYLSRKNETPADAKFERAVLEHLARRLAGEPIAYIVGQWEFYGLPIIVSRETLIPRPATETLVSAALQVIKKTGATKILDLCTGSGCVGLAIAKEAKSCGVVLIDNSEEALSVAKANTEALRLRRRVSVIRADVMKPPPAIGQHDMIVCNPPYIPSGEIDKLDKSVSAYEPRIALDGGADGLDFYRSIAAKWKIALKTGGNLLLECGAGQAEQVSGIMRGCKFSGIETLKDLAGTERVLFGIKK